MIQSFSDPAADAFRLEARAWIEEALPDNWAETQMKLRERELAPIRKAWDRSMFDAGYAGLAWPEAYGGRGLGLVEDLIFLEESARAHAPEGLGRVGRMMVGPMLIEYGSDRQRKRYLPHILDGSEYWCQGYSEPDAGSDLLAMTTTATRHNDHYEVIGRKIWTSRAHYADMCFLLARTSTTLPREHNISILLLHLHQPGVEIRPILTAAGDHHFNEVTLDNAKVPLDDLLGRENEGWELVRRSLVHERGVTAALAHYIELCHECDLLSACCGAGSPGDDLQVLRIKNDLVRWHVLRVTELLARGRSASGELAVLKLYWSELWQEIATFGMRAMCDEHREYWWYQYLRSRHTTISGGTSEIQRNMIASRVVLRHAARGAHT